MKTLFSMGFHSHNPFMVSDPVMGQFEPMFQTANEGVTSYNAAQEAAKNKLQAQISASSQKWAQVKAWIASRIDADPMLRKTLTKGDASQNFVVDNFWGYDDLINKDQYYVDLAQRQLAAGQTPSDDTVAYVDEWSKVIDIMYAAMQEYGGAVRTPQPVTMGPPTISPTTGRPVPSSITPGSTIQTQPPSSGIANNTLLWAGGAALAAVALTALLMRKK